MDQKTFNHYFQAWSLLESLKEPFWTIEEKEKITQTLKDITVSDANLQELDINAPDFLEQLKIKLQALLTAQPETPPPNIPPPEVFQNYESYLLQLNQKREKTRLPIIFLKEGSPLNFSEEIYQILKQKQLVDDEGEIKLNQASKNTRTEVEKEIGKLTTLHQWRSHLYQKISFSLEGSVPLTLFRKEFFGIGEIPGIIGQVTEEIITALQKGKEFDYQKVSKIVKNYLEISPRFSLLYSTHQQEIQQKTKEIVTREIQNFQLRYPKGLNRTAVNQKDEDFYLTIFTPQEEKYTISSTPVHPRTIAKRTQRELNLPATVKSTENLQRFISSFVNNPISATLNYPYYSLINLLPNPFKKLYWQRKRMAKTWELWYGISISPDAQRKALQNLGWQAIKAFLKPLGGQILVNKEGQWFWTSTLGWAGEKVVTKIGESFANFFDKFGKPGKSFGKILHRRIGRERKREESILTGFLGVILDTTTRLLGFLLKKTIWSLIKNLPIVKKIGQLWVNFRYLLESKLPLLKYLRIGKGVIGSLIRAVPHGLISGGLGYLASGGNIGWTITAGASDWLFHFIKNLGKIPEISLWAKGPHVSVGGKIFGWLIRSPHFYLPIKSFTFSFILTDSILPALGINLPVWARWFIRLGLTGLDYGWQAELKPLLKLKLPSFIAKWITGPLGKLLGGIIGGLPGGIILPQVLSALGINPLLSYLIGIPAGIAVWWVLMKFILPSLAPYTIFGWLGMIGGEWLALKLGLTGIWPPLFQAGGFFLGSWLAKIGISSLVSWLGSQGITLSWSFVLGLFPSISASAVLATIGSILLIAGLTIFTIITVSSAFFQEKELRRGLVHPNLPIKKVIMKTSKNTNGEITAIDYQISYSYKPSTSDPSEYLDNIKIIDRFETPVVLSFFDNFPPPIGGNINPSVITPCEPLYNVGGGGKGFADFAWEQSRCSVLGPVWAGETKTIDIHLVLRKPWSSNWPSPVLKIDKICNSLGVWGTTSKGEKISSSLPPICLNREGKIVSPWDITWPIDSENITSCFNEKRGDYYHKGLDIGTGAMTPPERDVLAIDDGEIIFSGGSETGIYGFFVEIRHSNGWISKYAHLDPTRIPEAGKKVKKGEIIALSDNTGDSTGPHLHLEIFRDDLEKCGLTPMTEFSPCWVDPLCFYPLQWEKSGCPPPTQCKP